MVLVEDQINLSKNVRNKLGAYRKMDKIKKEKFPEENINLNTITTNDATKMVAELESDICAGCKCKMLFTNYLPFCVYQFSFDRIDNKKIHSIDNLKIVCWNCNSSGYNAVKLSCTRKCHINPDSSAIRKMNFETGDFKKHID